MHFNSLKKSIEMMYFYEYFSVASVSVSHQLSSSTTYLGPTIWSTFRRDLVVSWISERDSKEDTKFQQGREIPASTWDSNEDARFQRGREIPTRTRNSYDAARFSRDSRPNQPSWSRINVALQIPLFLFWTKHTWESMVASGFNIQHLSQRISCHFAKPVP